MERKMTCKAWLSAAFSVMAAFGILLTAAAAQEPAPEIAPGGTVLLRGSTPASATSTSATSPLPPAGPSNPLSTGPQPRPAPAPAHGWDASGFDRQFDRTGLTPQ